MTRQAQREGQEKRLVRQPFQTDRFAIPMELIPEGMTYEWKRQTIFGQVDTRHQINLARNHWKPVPSSRHPELAAPGANGDEPIMLDGMLLMERPSYLTEEARDEERQAAKGQVRDQMVRLGQTPTGQAPREAPRINRTMERGEIPDDE